MTHLAQSMSIPVCGSHFQGWRLQVAVYMAWTGPKSDPLQTGLGPQSKPHLELRGSKPKVQLALNIFCPWVESYPKKVKKKNGKVLEKPGSADLTQPDWLKDRLDLKCFSPTQAWPALKWAGLSMPRPSPAGLWRSLAAWIGRGFVWRRGQLTRALLILITTSEPSPAKAPSRCWPLQNNQSLLFFAFTISHDSNFISDDPTPKMHCALMEPLYSIW